MPKIPAYSPTNLPKASKPALLEQKLEISQADYDAFVQKALNAGEQAKEKKLGIWKESIE